MIRHVVACLLLMLTGLGATAQARPAGCDKACLEGIADRYHAAYLAHDPKLAPFSPHVRFTENNVEMPLPDGTWDTVTKEATRPLILSDPRTGMIGLYMAILQNDTPGYLAVRLKIERGQITEVEHIISTKRNLSTSPTPFGELEQYQPDPDLFATVPPAQRSSRADMIRLSDGYFSTLEHNNGEIRGTRFSPDATRVENGKSFPHIEAGFKSGYYAFNNRVRDRDYFLVDEQRGIVMSRAFIDHKGQLDEYQTTDGKTVRSIFREPQTWSVLEMFKIKNGMITAVQATFFQSPYYMRSPWSRKLDR